MRLPIHRAVLKAAGNIAAGTAVVGGTVAGMAGVPHGFAIAFSALAEMGLNNAAARLMNNPKFVHWAAQTTKMGGISPASINSLAQIADKTQDHEMALFAAALSAEQEKFKLKPGSDNVGVKEPLQLN